MKILFDKGNYVNIKKKCLLMILLITLIIISINILQVSAGKLDQYFVGNNTCEPLTDSVIWTAVATKIGPVTTKYNWTMDHTCPGAKSCDIANISTYFRTVWPAGGDDTSSLGDAYAQLANSTETDTGVWTRYCAYLNKSTMASGEVFGPMWHCGEGASTTACGVANQGFNNATRKYAVKLYSFGEGGAVKSGYVTDIFNIKYNWCWIPLIYNASVSPDNAEYTKEFNFTIMVTNPSANTTVSLFTRTIGGTWEQESSQSCANCSKTQLSFPVTFAEAKIGNREFKFNATDDAGYSMEAGKPASLETVTDECVDSGNDCKFEIKSAAVEEGTPTLEDETVNGITSGATEGWGYLKWNFSVNVSNPTGGAGDINLTFSIDTGEGFLDRETQVCSSPCSTSKRFYFNVTNFTCSDISTSAQYEFSATNLNGTSTTTQSFKIEEDDIYYEYHKGEGDTFNRSGDQTNLLSFKVYDANNGSALSNFAVKFFITYNNVSFYPSTDASSDSIYEAVTNSSAYVNFYFNATREGEYSGAPKFAVGEQQWKIRVNDSELTCYKQNDSYSAIPRRLFVWGDIVPTLTKPYAHNALGGKNFTQGEIIDFLGSTVDDCGDSLTLNISNASKEITYYIEHSSGNSYNCTENITLVGSNAYTCNLETSLSTLKGWYNASFYTNRSYHYSNSTLKYQAPGLFSMLSMLNLKTPKVIPEVEGWGYPNWNFSVIASSGDPDVAYNVSVYVGTSWPPSKCTTCANQTTIECKYPDCTEETKSWFRNFTSSEKGIWYYQFKMDDPDETKTSTVETFNVSADTTSFTHFSGDNSNVVVGGASSSAVLILVVKDTTSGQNVSTPPAHVNFETTTDGNNFQFIGTNSTNSTGHVAMTFNATCDYSTDAQKWRGYINTTESNNYYYNISANFTVNVDASACVASINIEEVKQPTDIFQNKSFGINVTVKANEGVATSTNVTINVPSGWVVSPSDKIELGDIASGTTKDAHWDVKPTSYNNFTISFAANASGGLSDTDSTEVFIYKWLLNSTPQEALLYDTSGNLNCNDNICDVTTHVSSIDVNVGNSLDDNSVEAELTKDQSPREYIIASWPCEAGDYEYSNLTVNLEGNADKSMVRISSYNGSDYVKIYRKEITNNAERIDVKILEDQLIPDEGYCKIKIENINENNLMLDYLSLQGYYKPSIKVKDILSRKENTKITGMEPGDGLFNISVRVENANNTDYTVNLELNITDSAGNVVNSSKFTGETLSAGTTLEKNVTDIDTSSWSADTYNLEAYVTGDILTQRKENFIFKPVNLTIKSSKYRCNGTKEYFNVTIIHPFTDKISYNVSLENTSGWSYEPLSVIVNLTDISNYTVQFNLTSSQAAETKDTNATITYIYPVSSKNKNESFAIETGTSVPILEVIRETPKEVANNLEFYSRLVIRNKGCAAAETVSLTESVSSGWTAYGQTLDGVSAGESDIPAGEIRIPSSDFGSINMGEYKIVAYKVLSHSNKEKVGTFNYELKWGNRNITEDESFKASTINYTSEKHLSFDLISEGETVARKRSANPSANQSYNLSVKNIGDANIPVNAWNVSLYVPTGCEVSGYTGNWDSTTRKINWQLGALAKESSTVLEFDMNCTKEKKYLLRAEGINNTKGTQTYTEYTGISCSGASCSNSSSITLSHPNKDYEKISEIDFYTKYDWDGYNLTIGKGAVNITDDSGVKKIVYQEFSFDEAQDAKWVNYSLTDEEQGQFETQTHNIGVMSYTDAISGETGTITVDNLTYTWSYGRSFEDSQPLMVNIKTYTFVPDPPTLEAPPNASEQASENIVLSWLPVTGATKYYVYGNNTFPLNESHLLAEATVTNYLWSERTSDTWYWRVKSGTATQNSTFSETWQFDVDICAAGGGPALNYPMSFDSATEKITIWGNNTLGNKTNPITFAQIYDFGKAVYGACAVTNPATGSYAVLVPLDIGNTSSVLNETYVKTSGESIDFGKQVTLKAKAHLISGLKSEEANPYAGSTLSFSGTDATDPKEGELYLLEGSFLELYDSFLLHKTDATDSNPWKLYWNGNVLAKRSSLESWWTIRFLGGNNTLEDIVITNVGEGFYPATTQIGTLDTIKSRKTIEDGVYFYDKTNVTINNLEIAETNWSDIKVINYTGVANLKNPILNWSSINWSTGSYSGKINRKYTYDLTITDSDGGPISDVSVTLMDKKGDIVFNLSTNSEGKIDQQLITRAIFDYTDKTGNDQGPHTLYIRKYGQNFQKVVKEFSSATVETVQLAANEFTTLTEADASAQTGIIYTKPSKVTWSSAEDETVSSGEITLDNTPVTQSEFLNLYNSSNGIKIPAASYSVNYETGVVAFTGYEGIGVRAVYSYNGSVQIIGNRSTSQIYDYLQANKSDVIATATGSIYDSYVDIILGNSSDSGGINESSGKTLNIKEGFGFSASAGGARTINVLSDAWNFTWKADNGTFYQEYTFDITVKDSQGNPLSGANVKLKDKTGTAVVDQDSGEDGKIPTQEVIYREYIDDNGDTPTEHGPHTLELTKAQYVTYSGQAIVDSAQDLSFSLGQECDAIGEPLNYPMSFDSVTEKITVWGSDGSDGYDVMGNNESNAITFEDIFNFGKSVYGSCAITNPATGSYAMLILLEIGNTSSDLNETYVKTSGESIDFGKQVTLKANARLISGLKSEEENPYSGSTLSFSGKDATSSEEGQLYTLKDSFLELYDSFLLHKEDANNSNQWKLYWNGNVLAKRSSLENWWTIRFLGDNNTLEDIVITNVGEGFYPATTQIGTLDTIKSRKTIEDGVYFYDKTNVTINNLEIAETNGSDVRVIDYTGIASIVNSELNWSSINWSTGSYSGKLNRKYTFKVKVTDAAGSPIVNATVLLQDKDSNVVVKENTTATGETSINTITTDQYTYDNKTGVTKNPHVLTVSHSAYQTYTQQMEITAATDMSLALGDPCDPDATYSQYLVYPMEYNFSTDIFTIIGNSTMGTASNPITFKQMFEFAKATKGTCIMDRPAAGTYAIKSRLIIGNETPEVFVESKGESISFSSTTMPQLVVNKSAHLTFGGIRDGIPQEGCSLKFASNTFNDILLDVAGGEIAFYDSYVTDSGSTWGRFIYRGNCGSGSNYASENSSITIKKTIFDRATRGQWLFTSNATIDDIKINRINSSAAEGYGLVIGCDSSSITLTNLQIYHQELNGSAVATNNNAPNNTEIIVQDSTFKYNIKDVIATGNGRGFQLINTEWDRTYGWNFGDDINGTDPVTIKEAYGFLPTITDSAGSTLENVMIVALDIFGDLAFSLSTDSNGEITEQYMSTWQVEKSTSGEAITEFNPYTVSIKKYGKSFTTEAKTFAARTVETKQLANNIFTSLSESAAAAQTGLTYIPSIQVNYDDESHSGWTSSGQLDNYPVDSCQFFTLFADETKLVEGSTNNYTIDYGTGEITFYQDMSAYDIKPVYSYGGNITVTNGLTVTNAFTMSNIYDYMQEQTANNNLSADLTTVDGLAYTSCIDMIMGNDTAKGSIGDTTATITFNDGYDLTLIGQGGYLDLSGIVIGVGGLLVKGAVGPSYNPGDEVIIYATTTDSNGKLVSATVNTTLYYPNGSISTSGLATETTTGQFNFSYTLSANDPTGTYNIDVDATSDDDEAHDALAFKVETAGGGAGGLPLNIYNDVGTSYEPGDMVNVLSTTLDSSGNLVNATVNVTVYYQNGSMLNSGLSTIITAGRFKYNFTLSGSAPQETYKVDIDANYSGNEVHDNLVFVVATVGGGAANPEVIVEAPDVINTNTKFDIIALTKNDAGQAEDCASGASITIKDTLADNVLVPSTAMTDFGAGLYNYTWSTSTQSTFLATVVCTMSGKDYNGITEFSTQDVAGAGGSGGLPLNIFSDVGSFYSPGDEVAVFSTVTDSDGVLVSATVNVSVFYPNSSILNNGPSTEQDAGRFKYDFTLPSLSPIGTYETRIDANYSGNEIHETLTFIVSSAIEDIKANLTYIVDKIDDTIIPAIQEINTTTQNNYDYLQNTVYPKVDDANSTIYDVLDKWGNYNASFIYEKVNDTYNTASDIYIDTQNLLTKWGTRTAEELFNEVNDTEEKLEELLNKWGDYDASQLYERINLTYNDTKQILTYIGLPSDEEGENTLFGEHAYTQNRVSEIEGNVTEIKTIVTEINITTAEINSTVSSILLEVDNLEEMHQCSLESNTTICSMLSAIKTETENIYGLTIEINATTLSMNLFSISSLAAGSPRYANEEALIEVTFTTQNGSFIEPDEINLIIYDKNDNEWATATKGNFQETDNHVWWYSKSIGDSPTTGMYTVHMQASYNDIDASASTQFRIATGGPYKVTLECPLTSNVGENLNCDVTIQDEGEVPTESTCYTWIDTNENEERDSGEPKTQFSKETEPLDTVIVPISINVPSTHSIGYYDTWVSCSYANSIQPPSTASDGVTLEKVVDAPPPGGVPSEGKEMEEKEEEITPAISFDVDLSKIESKLLTTPLEGKITFTLDGTTTHSIKLQAISKTKATFTISSEPITITVNIGETKNVDINKDGTSDIKITVHGIEDNFVTYTVNRIEEGIKLIGKVISEIVSLFDVKTRILPKYIRILAGNSLAAEISIYNVGGKVAKDTRVNYYIKDIEEKLITVEHETIAVIDKVTILKEMSIPKNLEPGEYIFVVEVNYNSKFASSSARFNVIEEGFSIKEKISYWPFILIILILLTAYILLKKRRRIIGAYRKALIIKKILTNKTVLMVISALIISYILVQIPYKNILNKIAEVAFKETHIMWLLLFGILIILICILKEVKKIKLPRKLLSSLRRSIPKYKPRLPELPVERILTPIKEKVKKIHRRKELSPKEIKYLKDMESLENLGFKVKKTPTVWEKLEEIKAKKELKRKSKEIITKPLKPEVEKSRVRRVLERIKEQENLVRKRLKPSERVKEEVAELFEEHEGIKSKVEEKPKEFKQKEQLKEYKREEKIRPKRAEKTSDKKKMLEKLKEVYK